MIDPLAVGESCKENTVFRCTISGIDDISVCFSGKNQDKICPVGRLPWVRLGVNISCLFL